MPRRPGRPRTNLERKILAAMSADEKQAEEIVARRINSNTPSIMAYEAACLRLGLKKEPSLAIIEQADFSED